MRKIDKPQKTAIESNETVFEYRGQQVPNELSGDDLVQMLYEMPDPKLYD